MAARSPRARKRQSSRSSKLSFNRHRGSGRAFTLLILLFAMTLFLAPPIKNYFTQRAQISSLKAQIKSDYVALDAARKELTLWQDPNYIKSQARERLHFVMPGERQYIVTGDGGSDQTNTTASNVVTNLPDGQPWYLRMIASITEVGNK